MELKTKPLCDLELARSSLLDSIESIGNVIQDLEVRLELVLIPAPAEVDCSPEAPVPPRSKLAEELYSRTRRIRGLADRLRQLRDSLDL